MIATTPLWIVLIDYFRPWRLWGVRSRFARPRPRALLGVVIGFFGVAFLITAGGTVSGSIDPVAGTVVILGTFLWACGSLYGRGAQLPASPLLGTGMEMLVGGLGLLLMGTLAGEWARLDPSTITTRSIVALLYLIVVGSWGGFGSYVWLLRNAPTPLVATYAYVNPLVALSLGALLAGEPITPRVVIAAAIIIGAVAVTTSSRTPKTD
jgi:drug/metabolite transporter (DMT)-like permease